MTNNERFRQALNACQDPRRVYQALGAFLSNGRQGRPQQHPQPPVPLPLSPARAGKEQP